MTVNKFGSYLSIVSQPHRLAAPPPVEIRSFKSICFFTLKGKQQDKDLSYMLENGSNSYEFKINGIIDKIDTSASPILISINKEQPMAISTLLNRTINKGDTIQILRDFPKPVSETVLLEFVLLCPLVQDE